MTKRKDEGPKERRGEPAKDPSNVPQMEPRRVNANPFAKLKDQLGPLPPGPALPSSVPAKNLTGARTPIKERVTVRRERSGHGGKAVTIAEGPAFTGRKLDEYAKEIARSLGAGARVEGQTLVVQGDQADRVASWLRSKGFEQVARGN